MLLIKLLSSHKRVLLSLACSQYVALPSVATVLCDPVLCVRVSRDSRSCDSLGTSDCITSHMFTSRCKG